MTAEESKAMRRYCSAVLEYRHLPPYKNHVKKVCEEMKDGSVTDERHEALMEAIIQSLLNRKENPFSLLQRRYDLPVARNKFSEMKNEFCHLLSKRCGFPNTEASDRFSKNDILNMLFVIADEANECIRKDGSFNHQVAGVALKAIDQAMRIYDMRDESSSESTNEIAMDDPSRRLGA